jgi:hypothetical protein
MAGSKLSERARQNDLRQRMRAAGVRNAAIAAEFGRRYRLRPRKAWRYAYGWTLRQAAERINGLAARDGLDPHSKAGMTAAHLCEYEEWPGGARPGNGREPTGRKPTPYILSLLALAYATTVASLVDDADRAWLPPADRLVISELSGASRALAAAGRDGLAPDRGGAGPHAEVLMAAHEGRRHAENAARRDAGDTALELMRDEVTRLSRAYMTGAPFPLFLQMRRLRGDLHTALGLRLWPHDQAELYLLLSLVNSLMAAAASDLGHGPAAEELARTGGAYATIIGHGPVLAHLRNELASIAYWAGRPRQSRDYAADGLDHLARGPNAAQLHLHRGRAAAQLGDTDTARRAIAAAAEARERQHHDELLEIGGQFGFSLATQHYLSGAALAELPGAEKDAAAELEHAAALYERGPGPGEDHSFGCAALARTALAATRLRAGQLDGARPALASVLALPRAQRIGSLTPSLGRVRAELARPRYQSAAGAADLDERIEQFLRETAAGRALLPPARVRGGHRGDDHHRGGPVAVRAGRLPRLAARRSAARTAGAAGAARAPRPTACCASNRSAGPAPIGLKPDRFRSAANCRPRAYRICPTASPSSARPVTRWAAGRWRRTSRPDGAGFRRVHASTRAG